MVFARLCSSKSKSLCPCDDHLLDSTFIGHNLFWWTYSCTLLFDDHKNISWKKCTFMTKVTLDWHVLWHSNQITWDTWLFWEPPWSAWLDCTATLSQEAAAGALWPGVGGGHGSAGGGQGPESGHQGWGPPPPPDTAAPGASWCVRGLGRGTLRKYHFTWYMFLFIGRWRYCKAMTLTAWIKQTIS